MMPVLRDGNFAVANRLTYIFFKPKLDDVIAILDPRDGKILIKRITKIERDKYFVEGDNKGASTDSRHFGLIARESIIGKVIWLSRY